MNELKNKTITIFAKLPAGFRYSGLVIDENEGFIILRNDRTNQINYIAKDNVTSIEVS